MYKMVVKYGESNMGKKLLCLIIDALTPTKDPRKVTKEKLFKIFAEEMVAYGMKMEFIVVGGEQVWDVDRKIVEENGFLLSLLPNESSESRTSSFGALRAHTREIIYRGDFELSSTIKIKVRLSSTKAFQLSYYLDSCVLNFFFICANFDQIYLYFENVIYFGFILISIRSRSARIQLQL